MIKYLNKQADGYVWLMLITIFLCFFLFITLEIYRDYTIRDRYSTELRRAANIAVECAMNEQARQDGISSMDTKKAKTEFLGYLTNDMKMTGSYPTYSYKNNGFQFSIKINTLNITDEPARIECSADLILQPMFDADVLPDVELPLKVKSKNVRIEGCDIPHI